MKNRAFKNKLYATYASIKPEIKKAITTPFIEVTKIQQPITKVANPFDLLFKDLQPITEIVEVVDPDAAPKKRGRPRKPTAEDGSILNRTDDSEEEPREITSWMKNRMIEEFRRAYIVNQDPIQPTIEKIAKRYRLTYLQVHLTIEPQL